MKRLFGNYNLTWKKLIVFAILIGVYVGLINQVSFLYETSFRDIAITFEWWILFGIFIIMNSKSNKDSALKCFIFFLISQTLIFLVEVPFLGWVVLVYYKWWFIYTLFTIVMGYIGYYMKKDKWYSLIILLPMLLLLSTYASGFLSDVLFYFPHHLLSFIFSIVTLIMYPLVLFNNKKIKYIGLAISIVLLIYSVYTGIFNGYNYNTVLLCSNENHLVDENTVLSIDDTSMGKVYLKYEEGIEVYCVGATFTKAGETSINIKNNDEIKKYGIKVSKNTYDLEED